MLVRETGKNEVTLPKVIVQQLPDVEYFDVSVSDGAVIQRAVVISTPGGRVKGVCVQIRALGLTEKDVEWAVRWAQRRRACSGTASWLGVPRWRSTRRKTVRVRGGG